MQNLESTRINHLEFFQRRKNQWN